MTTRLKSFRDDVWIVDQPLRIAGMNMGTRSTIFRLPSGRLVVVGPVDFDDATAAAIDDLGDVDTIVAPNLQHHFYFNRACRRWPGARPLVPTKLGDKTDLVDRAATMGQRGSIEETLHWHRIEGADKVGEYVFVDSRAGVVVLTDLAFHYVDHPQWWLRTVMRLNGVYGRFGPSRLIRFLISDDEAFGDSLAKLLDYRWDSIVVAHGDPIEEGGREAFVEAFEGYLPE